MILYLALGALAFALAAYVYRRNPGVQRGRWRVGAGLLCVLLLTSGGFIAARGETVPGLVLVAIALAMAFAARSRRGPKVAPPPPTRALSASEARAMLGLEETAGPQEVRAAYTRLMRLAHPDKGGTAGLAAQLNAARDRLLGGK